MKNLLMIAVLAVAVAPAFSVAAQADKPAAKPAAPAMPKMAEPEPMRMASRAHVDARECLKLETNMAIHSCAEKFR